jgi:hypothetical protein
MGFPLVLACGPLCWFTCNAGGTPATRHSRDGCVPAVGAGIEQAEALFILKTAVEFE